MNQIHDIFDRASKRCLSLSKRGTIMLINGLYNKDYPLDSQVDYNWTEHEDGDLRKTLADTIITINRADAYHMEVQMYTDREIVLRVFEYGYRHAIINRNGHEMLVFPNPKILYLYEDGNAPEYQELLIDFGSQGIFRYRVSTCRYLAMSMEELQSRKLIVLLPFQLLRLRKAIEKERTPENLELLKRLIRHDIIEVIQNNVAAGNLTLSEGRKLKQITLQLYRHIYKKYAEMEKEGVNTMVEEALILDIDVIEMEHKRELQRKDQLIQEKDKIIQELKSKLKHTGLSIEEIDNL